MLMAALCLGSSLKQMRDPPFQEDSELMVDDVDRARAQEYALLATLLSKSPDTRMIGRLALLWGDASPLGETHTALAKAAAKATADSVKMEYFDLFDALGGGGLLPYASYYLTGSLYGRPLARLRETLQSLGIERTEHNSEPEDHAAILCEIMAGLAGGRIPAPVEAEREFFEKSIRPILVGKCYSCHSAGAEKLKGKLLLDSRQGVAAGGEGGTIIAGRDPDRSRAGQYGALRPEQDDRQQEPWRYRPRQRRQHGQQHKRHRQEDDQRAALRIRRPECVPQCCAAGTHGKRIDRQHEDRCGDAEGDVARVIPKREPCI